MSFLELVTKNKGSVSERTIDKIFTICNKQGKDDTLLLQAKDMLLSVLKLTDDEVKEITAKKIKSFEKVVGAFTNTDVTGLSSEDALVLVKVSEGIAFYKVEASTGQLTYLNQLDDQFDDDYDWKNQLMLGGNVHSNPKTVSIVALRDDENVKIFTLNGTDLEGGFKREWSIIPESSELYNATQVWVTKSGYSANGEGESDWITGRNGENIMSFTLVYDTKQGKDVLQKVLTIKLPNDLMDSVKSVQFLPTPDEKTSSKFQDMVVFFKEDAAIIYGYEDDKKGFQALSYFYGSDSFLSTSCYGKKVFAVSDGPTIKAFENQTVTETPVRWYEDLMRNTFVLSGNNENDVWVIGNPSGSDDLVWYKSELQKIKEIPYIKPNRTVGPGQDFPEVSQSKVKEMKFNLRVDRSFLDTISSQTFTEAVSLQTGGIGFDLNMIPELGFGIEYTSTQVGYEGGPPTMGKDGWSTRSPNYITMDPKSDTFDSEATYYLILDSAVYSLEFKKTSPDGTNLYKIVDSKMTQKESDSIRVAHEPSSSVWTVDTKTSKLTFGDTESAIKWAWSTRNWEESAEKSMVKVPSEWYMTRFVKKQYDPDLKTSLVLLYDYYQVMGWTQQEDKSKRKQYTKAVQLVKVHSENSNEVLMDLQYDENRLLQSYDAQVQFYKQNVQFVYNSNQVLAEVKQNFYGNWETMIKFSYDKTGQVSKVEVPGRALVVDFNHKLLSFSGLEGDVAVKMEDAPANTMATAAHSNSLSVFATTNRLFTYNAADGKTKELGSLKPITEDLKQLKVVIYKNSVIRHAKVSHGDYVDVFGFNATAENPTWKLSKKKYYPGDVNTDVTQGGNLITLDEKGTLKIAKWNYKDSEFNTTSKFDISVAGGRPKIFQAYDNLISWYNVDSRTISWVAKMFKGWSDVLSYQFTTPNYENCANFFKDNFDLGPKGDEAFHNLFSNLFVQVRDNAMAVTTCSIDDEWQIRSHVDLLILDRKGNRSLNKRFDISQENLKILKKTEDKYDFKYVKEGGKFLLQVSDPNHPDETEEITKEFRKQNEKQDFRYTIFDHTKYIGYFVSKSIFQVGNSTQIKTSDDGKWIVDSDYDPNGKFNVTLGNRYKLARLDKDKPVVIIDGRTNDTLYTLAKDSNNIFPLYPGFVASLDGNNTEVVSFIIDENGSEITAPISFEDEVIRAGLSSSEYLVTSVPESPNKFTIRLAAWVGTNVHKMYAVDSVNIKGNQLAKTYACEYQKARMTKDRKMNFGAASLIRGGNKSKYGYIEYSFDINHKYPKAYDPNGTFLKEIKPDHGPNPKREDSPNMLLGKWGIRAITDMSPFKPEDCQVGYIGFEDYENTSVGPSCPWNFSKNSVIRNEMTLTGNNFLRLKTPQESLSNEFLLRKGQSYSISTWVRRQNGNDKPDAVSKILQATVKGVTLSSKVIFTRGDWEYLQIKIDAQELKSLWKNVLRKKLGAEDQKVRIEIRGEESDGQVDVDNALFAHSSWNSEIFVYNEKGIIRYNLLGNTGLIVENLYDTIEGDAVAKTNGVGQVNRMQFETLDDAKSLRSLVQLESLVEPGWIQVFQHDPFANFALEKGVNVFKNGFQYNNFSKENQLTIDVGYSNSVAFRFSYTFLDVKASAIKVAISDQEYTLKSGPSSTPSSSAFKKEFKLKSSGSIVFSLIGSRLIIWTPQGLLWEEGNAAALTTGKITVSFIGNLILENMITLPNPSLKITYSDTEIRELQVLNFNNETTVKVFQNQYDPVGRIQARVKETFVTVGSNESLIKFRSDFVTSFDVENQKLEGEASSLNPADGGVPFVSVIYDEGPTQDSKAEGRPGPKYSVLGPFANKYSRDPIERLEILFPPKMGYKYKSKSNNDGYTEVVITDESGAIAANSALTPGAKHLLATYDYDEEGLLVASLSPQYHEIHDTLLSLNKSWKEIGYSKDDPFGTFYEYDKKGTLIKKSAPDVGVFEYTFDEETGNPTFALHRASTKVQTYDSIIYYEYQDYLLSNVGELSGFDPHLKKQDLINGSVKATKNPIKVIENLGKIRDALTQTQRITTKQLGKPNTDVIQELDYVLPQGRLAADVLIVPSKPDEPATQLSTRFKMSLEGDKVLLIGYALDDVAVGYKYNLVGQVSHVYYIKEGLKPVTIARYDYDPSGQVSKETLLDLNTGNQQLMAPLETIVQFNSPGYPVSFSNPFFVQQINYEDNGYGDLSTGEPGYPGSTTFDNLWAKDIARLTLESLSKQGLSGNDAEVCYTALQHLGYLNDHGKILKLFRINRDMEGLPIICSDSTSVSISTAFSEVFIDGMKFSYKFQYGNHKELIKVKFVDSKNEMDSACSKPLTVQALQKSIEADEDTSRKLWKDLNDKGFLIEDKEKGKGHTVQGMSNIPLWNQDIVSDLQSRIQLPERFGPAIAYSLGTRVGGNFPEEEFSKIFQMWTTGIDKLGTTAADIYGLLQSKGYLSQAVVQQKILQSDFTQILKTLNLDMKKVFSGLTSYFSCQIGKNPFDMQVFEMDYNGNPNVFYNGLTRVELKYKPNSNMISSREIYLGKAQNIGHDMFGNLNSIVDVNGKPVLVIDYDKISSRPVKMELGDGRKMYFRYDYKGERVSKQVYGASGKLEQEIKYLGRDSQGRVLVEQELTYISENLPPRKRTTSFFYGPRGLFAFLRNGKYFNVLLDNIGSTRLVLRNGQVAASYTYLPYGKLASKYVGSDPDGDIRYRFTGQEFDEETGLYNFHFRIYDPSIGRFYQVDPLEEFFSPYKYAGNAPIVFTDPSGRFVFIILALITLTLAVVGAYLGGAAANNSWNPVHWKWDSYKTWVGIGLGALAGGLLPESFGESLAFLAPILGSEAAAAGLIVGLGAGAAYLSMASAENNWDPTKWDWTSPELYNAAFTGFATGAGFIGGVKGAREAFIGFTRTTTKVAFIGGAATLGLGFGYFKASEANNNEFRFWKWDFTKPGTYDGLIVSGASTSLLITKIANIRQIADTVVEETKGGFVSLGNTIMKVMKRYKSYDFVKEVEEISPLTPVGAVKTIIIAITNGIKSAFSGDSDPILLEFAKTDLEQIAKGGGLSTTFAVMNQGMQGDLAVTNPFNTKPKTFDFISYVNATHENPWMEHVADVAFGQLYGLSNRSKTIVAGAFLMNNGELLAITGLSGFSFDGAVILLEKKHHPELFRFIKDYETYSSPLTNSGKIQHVSSEMTVNKLVSLPHDSTHGSEDNQYCEAFGKISNFDAAINNPFRNMNPRGSNYLIPQETHATKTILTHSDWNTQKDVCHFETGLPKLFSSFSDESRVQRSVFNYTLDESSSNITESKFTRPMGDSNIHSASSSSSRPMGFINYGVKLLSNLWNRVVQPQQKPVTGDESASSNFNRGFGSFFGEKEKGKQDTNAWSKCVPWVYSEDGYVDGFTCVSSSGIVQVTPKLQGDLEQGAIMSTDSRDTYGNCNFYKGRGIGSAYCEGHKSNMRYISFIDERPFDRVNDNLLLVALLLHFYQTCKSDTEVEDKSNKVSIESQKMLEWKRELQSLHLGLQQLRSRTRDEFYHDWALNLLEDRMTDLEQFEKEGTATAESMQEFEDNVAALREEIFEGFLLSNF